MRPSTIALFDIDGTLVSCGGAGRRSMERMFADLGVPASACAFDFGGMTDRAIVRQSLGNAGLGDDEVTMERCLAGYLSHLRDEVPRSPTYTVRPGVLELLSRLEAITGVAVGLGTGNIEEGARVKLTRGELAHRFSFGGFGSDHEDRAQLLAIGAERGAARLGKPLRDCRVVVIGDTPRDVAAARAIGAECLAVATGTHALDVLRDAGAHVAIEHLASPGALEVVLGGGS
jgi:phosphoglycolate phosphatase